MATWLILRILEVVSNLQLRGRYNVGLVAKTTAPERFTFRMERIRGSCLQTMSAEIAFLRNHGLKNLRERPVRALMFHVRGLAMGK